MNDKFVLVRGGAGVRSVYNALKTWYDKGASDGSQKNVPREWQK